MVHKRLRDAHLGNYCTSLVCTVAWLLFRGSSVAVCHASQTSCAAPLCEGTALSPPARHQYQKVSRQRIKDAATDDNSAEGCHDSSSSKLRPVAFQQQYALSKYHLISDRDGLLAHAKRKKKHTGLFFQGRPRVQGTTLLVFE